MVMVCELLPPVDPPEEEVPPEEQAARDRANPSTKTAAVLRWGSAPLREELSVVVSWRAVVVIAMYSEGEANPDVSESKHGGRGRHRQPRLEPSRGTAVSKKRL
jgi:hypothetical protein